jgi:hypothetical protein
MAESDVSICNKALGHVGTRSTIASLAEKSNEAIQCALYYESTRDSILRAEHWNFAGFQQPLTMLASLATSPIPPSPWQFEYAYPSDCLKCRYILPIMGSDPPPSSIALTSAPVQIVAAPNWIGPVVKFVVSSDVDAKGNQIKVILTNQAQAILKYTKRITDPGMFDSDFVEVLVLAIGAKLINALTGDLPRAKAKMEEAKSAMLTAQSIDGNEGPKTQDVMPDWVRVRGYSSDYGYPGQIWNGPDQLFDLN